MLARSCQMQGIFWLFKPLIHVQIMVWKWSVDMNDGVYDKRQKWWRSPEMLSHEKICDSTSAMREKLPDEKLLQCVQIYEWSVSPTPISVKENQKCRHIM